MSLFGTRNSRLQTMCSAGDPGPDERSGLRLRAGCRRTSLARVPRPADERVRRYVLVDFREAAPAVACATLQQTTIGARSSGSPQLLRIDRQRADALAGDGENRIRHRGTHGGGRGLCRRPSPLSFGRHSTTANSRPVRSSARSDGRSSGSVSMRVDSSNCRSTRPAHRWRTSAD
jgi:hypothetical protein